MAQQMKNSKESAEIKTIKSIGSTCIN